ncbi:MAG TPA: efflux transporter outer membrane subunit [Ramlibacter sp.]|jgi:NodT family efflux transporter outer membrane factor (OMF) lipoprotein|uniref:efflux transporter outer membrane subunit n=1 Tax=Ramlibacter sp. TaxID=1917967 RepID=UPI002D378B59|nr:efflux transporter outer membrane subunit [Ramlibacter sp.]HZY18085.1 efflux transporter outer membrane subunit [Ramlibacter sp.]
MTTRENKPALRLLCLALALALGGCALAPRYDAPPAIETPVAFKEGQGEWVRATPADAAERGPWWQAFDDPVLNDLAVRVEVSNQNVAASVAAYAQARALVAQQRAALFPTVTLNGSGNRSGSRGGGGGGTTVNSTTGTVVSAGGSERNTFQFNIGGSWEPDVWGRLSGALAGARASEQASFADLASARLSAQGELAVNYFNLRSLDLQRDLLARTVTGYERNVTITNNRYTAGIAARTDLLQAQTQLANARADLLGLEQQRAQLEHAIAVLVGQAPASFSLKAEPTWRLQVPAVPAALPSTLLQRRPDIAAAERRVAQANEEIGVARAAYFPSLRLTGSAGSSAATVGDLFSASALVWSLGLSAAQTVFNAGATGAQVEGARAAFEQAAARYRQAVLAAFQSVEDQLAATRILAEQLALREEASRSADLVEQQVLNRYQAGQVAFTEVITAQQTAQNARRALVQLQADRQVAAVSLIQALGGGWPGLDAGTAAAAR